MLTTCDTVPVSLAADLGFSLQGDDIAAGTNVAWSGVRTLCLAAPPPDAGGRPAGVAGPGFRAQRVRDLGQATGAHPGHRRARRTDRVPAPVPGGGVRRG